MHCSIVICVPRDWLQTTYLYCITMHTNLICRILGLKWRGCQKRKLYLLLNSMLQRRACIPFILLMTSTSLREWQGICSEELLLIIIKGLCYNMMTLLPCWCEKSCFSLFSLYQKALCGTFYLKTINFHCVELIN